MTGAETARCTKGVRQLAKARVGLRRSRCFEVACRRFAAGEIGVETFLHRHVIGTFGDQVDEVMSRWRLPDLVHDAERSVALRRTYAAYCAGLRAEDGTGAECRCSAAGAKGSGGPPHVCACSATRGARELRAPHSGSRPAVVVIGAMKCGTTSVYEYMNQHPDSVRCRSKEPHVFDWCWDKVRTLKVAARARLLAETLSARALQEGSRMARWKSEVNVRYLSAFKCEDLAAVGGQRKWTGEATPSYLLGGATVARRLHLASSGTKLIVCMRDPVDRVYSHYNMTADLHGTAAQKVRRGSVAGKRFGELVDEDINLLSNCARLCRDRWQTENCFQRRYLDSVPLDNGSHSYVGRGLYAAQLRLWLRVFPRERILVLWTGALRTPAGVQREMRKVFAFLGLPLCDVANTARKNARSYAPMTARARRRLAAYYASHNRELLELMSCAT
jgi:hypothetical protein